MNKNLKVIEPFFGLETGDILSLDKNGMYVSEYNSEYHENDEDDTAYASYNSKCSISPAYAKTLLADGYIEEVPDATKTDNFVNVFDEIDDMIHTYSNDLNELETKTSDMPEALKVEKKTVLMNLVKALSHLKSLRK